MVPPVPFEDKSSKASPNSDTMSVSEKSSTDLALEKMLQPTASQLLMGIARDVRNTTASFEEPKAENMLGGLNLLATVSKYMNVETTGEEESDNDNIPKMPKIETVNNESNEVKYEINVTTKEPIITSSSSQSMTLKDKSDKSAMPDGIKISLKQGKIDTVEIPVSEANKSLSQIGQTTETKDIVSQRPNNIKSESSTSSSVNVTTASVRGIRLLTLASQVSSPSYPAQISSGKDILQVVSSDMINKPQVSAQKIPTPSTRVINQTPTVGNLVRMRIVKENKGFAATNPSTKINMPTPQVLNIATPSQISTFLYRSQTSKTTAQLLPQKSSVNDLTLGAMRPTLPNKYVSTVIANPTKSFPGRIITETPGPVLNPLINGSATQTSLLNQPHSKNLQIISVSRPPSPAPMQLRSVSSTAGKTYIVLGSPKPANSDIGSNPIQSTPVKDTRILPFADL